MADGQRLSFKVDGLPPQPHHLGTAQSVKGCKLDDKFQLMALGGFKELFHFLGAVIACHERLRLGAVYLVHRVAGYQVDAHGVFQRFVKIGVESQDRGVFQRFRFVQIKALNLARLQPCQRYAQRFKVGNDVLFHIEAIGRVSSFRYGCAHHFQPVPHIVAECHIGAEFGHLTLGNREVFSRFCQHFFGAFFVALDGQPCADPRLTAFARRVGVTQHDVIKSVFLL